MPGRHRQLQAHELVAVAQAWKQPLFFPSSGHNSFLSGIAQGPSRLTAWIAFFKIMIVVLVHRSIWTRRGDCSPPSFYVALQQKGPSPSTAVQVRKTMTPGRESHAAYAGGGLMSSVSLGSQIPLVARTAFSHCARRLCSVCTLASHACSRMPPVSDSLDDDSLRFASESERAMP